MIGFLLSIIFILVVNFLKYNQQKEDSRKLEKKDTVKIIESDNDFEKIEVHHSPEKRSFLDKEKDILLEEKSSNSQLVQDIIFAEILSEPKSKNKKRHLF